MLRNTPQTATDFCQGEYILPLFNPKTREVFINIVMRGGGGVGEKREYILPYIYIRLFSAAVVVAGAGKTPTRRRTRKSLLRRRTRKSHNIIIKSDNDNEDNIDIDNDKSEENNEDTRLPCHDGLVALHWRGGL